MIHKVKRLLTMGPQEIRWRIHQKQIVLSERAAYGLGLHACGPRQWRRRLCRHVANSPAPDELALWWQQHMRRRHEPPFLLDAETLADSGRLFGQIFADRLPAVVQEAEQCCRGEFSFLGIEFRAHPRVDWQCDPLSGHDWPSRFYADLKIPFCDGAGSRDAPGDAKHVWELNRHEFLVSCAKAYFLTREIQFARRVFQLITDWIDTNPYLEGVNWSGPLEVAVRSLSWLWVHQFCREWEGLSAHDYLKWIKSFYQHGAYLDRHMEVYSSPNNHLVGEATALYLLGSFFPEFAESEQWRERAWGVLESQIARQFYEDGGSTEQSTSYHHYCLGFFVLAVLTRLRQELPVPPSMLERLEAAFSFSLWMTTPDGTVPRIGDTDDARSIRFGSSALWDFRNLLSLGAVMFQRGDMKAVAKKFSEDALWLLGPTGLRDFNAIPDSTPEGTSRVFPNSGYTVLRSGWEESAHYTCFDGGCIGIDLRNDDIPIFTHGHADMLSLHVCAFGKPLLVDGGFCTYNGSPEWHRWSRDVEAHNTLRLDGGSQAMFHAKNAWSRIAQPGSLEHQTRTGFEYIEGSHSGFAGVGNCSCHRRAVVWDRKSSWVILDRLEGTEEHFVEAFFHFAPGRVKVLPDRRGVSVTTEEGVHAVLQADCANRLKVDVRQGEADPNGGWIATSYGRRQPAPVVRFHGHITLPASLTFHLSCSLEEAAPSVIQETSGCKGHATGSRDGGPTAASSWRG